jgi:hypothetical protein
MFILPRCYLWLGVSCLPVTLTLLLSFGLTREVTGEAVVVRVVGRAEVLFTHNPNPNARFWFDLGNHGRGRSRGRVRRGELKLELKAEWAEREERVERRVTRNPNPNPKGGFWFDPGSYGRS